MKMGKVVLVGAGPGDIELVTVKGLRMIEQADVIIYDSLVNPALLKFGKTQCKNCYVGKRKGKHSVTQAQINQLIIEYTRVHPLVVRLKGGDPMLFGRAGEELKALDSAGITWEIVPGITAATGAAASVGLTLTNRNQFQAVSFVTAQRSSNATTSELAIDWELVLHEHQSVVFYMGLSLLPEIVAGLLTRGKSPGTTFSVVSEATLPGQVVVSGTLESIVQQVAAAHIKSPALLVMGPTPLITKTLLSEGLLMKDLPLAQLG
tara:strand:+ start:26425 stop:27213 length:789 start_codon:yes stop_codon:yes gene_type:complete